jgi:hypothetical protein
MLRIADRALPAGTLKTLAQLQVKVDAGADYAAQVALAKIQWDGKTSSQAKKATFLSIKSNLDQMCVGPRRCAYCEDSLADEIEHILPKNLFPEATFRWGNYLFACGPCNGPKSNRYGVVDGGAVVEFIRKRGDPVVHPPAGPAGCIDPREEDPLALLDLDLGGQTPGGEVFAGTFNFMPAENLSADDLARAEFSIDVLSLNREVMCVARANAFGGFRARLVEYRTLREQGGVGAILTRLRDDLLNTPHLTVFAEMRRQRASLPEIDGLFAAIPEATAWPLSR